MRCSFECRDIAATFVVHQATLNEALSRPYVLDLIVEAQWTDADASVLLGKSCEFSFDRSAVMRSVHGVVQGAEAIDDGEALRLRVVPALALLGERVNSRIFQDRTVPQIVRDVLMGETAAAGAPEGLPAFQRTLDDENLDAARYEPPRDYCVQYRESDLAFVSRLLEQEGIAYRFEAGDDHEVVQLVDDNATFGDLETLLGVNYLPTTALEGVQAAEVMLHESWERMRQPDRVLVRQWDWLARPDGSEHEQRASCDDAEAANATVYEHSETRTREVYSGDDLGEMHDDAERRAALALGRLQVGRHVGRGASNATDVAPGRRYRSDGDDTPEVALVVSATHHFTRDSDGHDVDYENDFVAVPADRAFVPQRVTRRPVIRGPQTAIVTGPPGEEIHTDAHGRIKVLMNWDRDGEGGLRRSQRRHPASSVWLRVAQMWAGAGWGTWFLPRIGMEVVVSFLDGDPDRPIVVGCLYNAANPVPYGLPAAKTRSTIKTASTPGGAGYNELRFEDAAGQEEVFVHAQRDYNTVVERDRTVTVGNDHESTIESNRTITVGKNSRLEAGETVTVRAPNKIELVCGGSKIVMTPDRIEVVAGGGGSLILDEHFSGHSVTSSHVLLAENVTLEASTGGMLMLTEAALLRDANDIARVELDRSAQVWGSGDAHAVFSDGAANIAGPQEASLGAGSSYLTCTPDDARLSSPDITIEGATSTVVDGGGGRAVFRDGQATVN